MRFAAPRTSGEPITALDRAAALMAAASAEVLRMVADVDRRGLWRRDGASSMTSWLTGRYALAWGTAREWVRVAHELEGLPRIEEAYACGRLSWDQLRPLTRFAAPETDGYWAGMAPELRPAALWREARRHERVRVQQTEETRRARYLSLDWDHERSVLWLEGMLPAEEGTAPRFWPGKRPRKDPSSRRPKAGSGWRPRACAVWPAMDGSSGSSSPGADRWGSADGAERSRRSSSGCSATGTEGPADSPGANGSGG